MSRLLPNWWAIAASRHRSAALRAEPRSGSQAKPAAAIAEPVAVAAILFACLAIPAVFAGA